MTQRHAGQLYSNGSPAGQWSWTPRGAESEVLWGDPSKWLPESAEHFIDAGDWVLLDGWLDHGTYYVITWASSRRTNVARKSRGTGRPAAGSPIAFVSCLLAHPERLTDIGPWRATRSRQSHQPGPPLIHHPGEPLHRSQSLQDRFNGAGFGTLSGCSPTVGSGVLREIPPEALSGVQSLVGLPWQRRRAGGRCGSSTRRRRNRLAGVFQWLIGRRKLQINPDGGSLWAGALLNQIGQVVEQQQTTAAWSVKLSQRAGGE
jgi:hypothetical protein